MRCPYNCLNSILIICFLISHTSCRKVIDEHQESKKYYNVSGVLFEKDGITPLKNQFLLLERSEIGGFTSKDTKNTPIAINVTDENGYFEFEYKHIGDFDGFHLQITSSQDDYFPIYKGIPKNRNQNVDITITPGFEVVFDISNSTDLQLGDTIYFSGIERFEFNDDIRPSFDSKLIITKSVLESNKIHARVNVESLNIVPKQFNGRHKLRSFFSTNKKDVYNYNFTGKDFSKSLNYIDSNLYLMPTINKFELNLN